ncbi:MAG: glycosyltransferase [bacterium]|nr:glycosyltransferase [bacterium]
MAQMKIIQFIASSGWGGAELCVAELSNALAHSHDVTALVMGDCAFTRKFSDSVKVIPLKSYGGRRNPFLFLELSGLIKDIKPDIVHTHAAKASEIIHAVGKFTKLNHVATKHNDRPGKIFDKIRKVTAVSELAASTIAPAGGTKVKVIYNGIEPVKIESPQKENIFTIVTAGRLDPVKGFDILIRSVRDLPFDFRLKIYGEGPERKNLQELINFIGLNGGISLEGYSDNIPAIMKSSHLVVVSSYSEGFGRVLIESLFYADAAVTTKVGVATEILTGDFMCDHDGLTEKIKDIYFNYADYKNKFRELSGKVSRKFLLAEITKQYVDFYSD